MYYAGASIITSVGINTEMTMAAIDAGISGCREVNYRCKHGKNAVMAVLDEGFFMHVPVNVEIDVPISSKLIRCTKMLAVVVEDFKKRIKLPGTVPFIWLASDSPEQESLNTEVMVDLLGQMEVPINTKMVYSVKFGRASGIFALKIVYDLFEKYQQDYVLIASAESPIDSLWLDELDSKGRLNGQGVYDGFSPGEGAGFILLARSYQLAEAAQAQLMDICPVKISPPGVAYSDSHLGNNLPHKGEALHEAITEAFSFMEDSDLPCDDIITSLNGELFWMKEHRVALARNNERLGESKVHHPFEYTGDLGALSGVSFLARSFDLVKSFKKKILAYSCSDCSLRAASIVQIDK